MKRPRSSSVAILFTTTVVVLSSSSNLPVANSQSLRASYSPSTADGQRLVLQDRGRGGGYDDVNTDADADAEMDVEMEMDAVIDLLSTNDDAVDVNDHPSVSDDSSSNNDNNNNNGQDAVQDVQDARGAQEANEESDDSTSSPLASTLSSLSSSQMEAYPVPTSSQREQSESLEHPADAASPSSATETESSSSAAAVADDEDADEEQPNTLFPLTIKLSTSSHHRAQTSNTNNGSNSGLKKGRTNSNNGNNINNMNSNNESNTIPLVGIGVGSLPHNKIPYILANALAGAQYHQQREKAHGNRDSELKDVNYRLIDTGHTSALEVLVGRSLGRLLGSGGGGGGGSSSSGIMMGEDTSYHVMIKIWHTHLGYERTMMSIHDTLSDIIPVASSTSSSSSNNNNNNGGNNNMSSNNSQNKKKMMTAMGINGSGGKTTSSLQGGTSPDIRIHAILQYPRCYDTIFQSRTYLSSNTSPKYTNCHEEEEALDSTVKSAGPSPLLDKESAWKRSYRALEELYHHGTLESIGVANFEKEDMEELYNLATVGPHIYQGTLRSLLLDQELIEGLVKHGVHYQVYDAPSSIIYGKEKAPRAYAKLERMGARHGGIDDALVSNADPHQTNSYGYSAIQLVLGWLVQRGVGVLPGTKNLTHLMENGPMSLASIPKFSPRESLDIENAVVALIQGVDLEDDAVVGKRRYNSSNNGGGGGGGMDRRDNLKNAYERGEFGSERMAFDDTTSSKRGDDYDGSEVAANEGVVATFFNALRRNIRIFHVHPNTGRQMQISQSIPPGRSGRLIVNPSDVLIAYDGHGVAVKKFLVEMEHGGRVDFSVEL